MVGSVGFGIDGTLTDGIDAFIDGTALDATDPTDGMDGTVGTCTLGTFAVIFIPSNLHRRIQAPILHRPNTLVGSYFEEPCSANP